MYLANPCGPDVVASMTAGDIGYIDTPAQGNKRPPGVTWCADNGCFGKGYPGDEKWLAWLERNSEDATRCLFATAPDVVGDAAATLERSAPWLSPIRALGYLAALVAQNHQENHGLPWRAFDVLFIGGSLECLPCDFVWPSDQDPERDQTCPLCSSRLTEWKEGEAARRLIGQAKARGKWVHMGRVNSERRFRYAHQVGCDSVDGTFLVFGPDKNLPRLRSWLRVSDQGLMNFEEAS
jgi:hypothetical protein